jgi:hypothetical protein
MEDFLKATGSLTLSLFDETGNLKELREVNNLVVTVGKNFIASRMKDSGSPTQMTHMAIGTGSTAAAAGNTTLSIEAARLEMATNGGVAGGTVATNTVTYSCTFPAGTGTGAIVEAGVFNGTPAGTMLCRTVFSVINKGASDILTINWNVTID